MARTDIWNTDEEYETEGQSLPHGKGVYGGYRKPGDLYDHDLLNDPEIQRMIEGWGVPNQNQNWQKNRPPPIDEKERKPPDPDDDATTASLDHVVAMFKSSDIDDMVAEEIAKLPNGHIPRPLRDPADKQHVLDALISRGIPRELALQKMKEYEGEPGQDYDTSDPNTYEYLEPWNKK